MSDKLYTIAEMAKKLNIPESTVRFYRDRYSDYMLYTGEGRKKRYHEGALEALRIIVEESRNNSTAEAIAERLERNFTKFIDVEKETAITTAGEQQQYNYNEQLTAVLSIMATQKQEIETLRNAVITLSEGLNETTATVTAVQQQLSEVQEKQAQAEDMEAHVKELNVKLMDIKDKMEQRKNRSFWGRLFNRE